MTLSSDSSTSTPAPSPRTNPSRSASNGLDARWGSSLRFDRALQALNPATPMGEIAALGASGDRDVRRAPANHVKGDPEGVRAAGAG